MTDQGQSNYNNGEEMHDAAMSTKTPAQLKLLFEARQSLLHELQWKRYELGLVCKIGALISLHENRLLTREEYIDQRHQYKFEPGFEISCADIL